MEKNERYINQTIGIINVTANDFKKHPYFKYHPERVIKFWGFKIKTIPEHIEDGYNFHLMNDIPKELKVTDGIVYTKPHVWIWEETFFQTYEEALSYAQFIAFQHGLVIDKAFKK